MSGWSFPSGKDKAKIPIGSKRFRSEDESKESALDKDSDDSSKEVSDEKKPPVHYEEGGAYYVVSILLLNNNTLLNNMIELNE